MRACQYIYIYIMNLSVLYTRAWRAIAHTRNNDEEEECGKDLRHHLVEEEHALPPVVGKPVVGRPVVLD